MHLDKWINTLATSGHDVLQENQITQMCNGIQTK